MKTERIMKLSEIEPSEHCPKCLSPYMERRSTFDKNVALWDIFERCKVCQYSRTFINVKVG